MSAGSSVKVVYSDLDGTMVGPGGSFFRTADRSLTDAPAQALVALHRAGIPLVLVSGRTRAQLVEAVRIFGADGFIGELGATVGWQGGRSYQVLGGALPAEHAGRLPIQVLADLGVVDALLAQWPGRLEWHSPWHQGHEADAMLRGLIDLPAAERWLAERGWGWLRLRDNGVLPVHRSSGLHPDAVPAHVYHLMPDGLTKGTAIAWDLRRRGLHGDDAIAIGDSASDLAMADQGRQLWLTANGAGQPHMAGLVAAYRNVCICTGKVGLGWAEAIRSSVLGEPAHGPAGAPAVPQ